MTPHRLNERLGTSSCCAVYRGITEDRDSSMIGVMQYNTR